VRAAVGRGWWYAYTPSGVSSFATGKGSREGGGREEDGGQKNSAGDEKRGSGRSAGNRGVSERSPARGFTYG